MQGSSIRGFKILVRRNNMAPYWSAGKWIDVLSKGGGQKKRFQYCLKPNCPEKLLYFRAIEGHSGKAYSGNVRINPALQDNVLLPKDFTKYVYHVGKELRSIMHNGLVPGGFSTKTGRHAVFFTVVNPMDDEQGLRETFCDLSKSRIAPYKNTWKPLQDMVYWCNLLLAQEGGPQFYQTRSNAVVLHDTLPAEFIGRAVCMKTVEQVYQRESARPRVVLRADSQCGLQDLQAISVHREFPPTSSRSMAWNQHRHRNRWAVEEPSPAADTHFARFARLRLTKQTEFVRGHLLLLNFRNKQEARVAPDDGAAALSKGSVVFGTQSKFEPAAKPREPRAAEEENSTRTLGRQTGPCRREE